MTKCMVYNGKKPMDLDDLEVPTVACQHIPGFAEDLLFIFPGGLFSILVGVLQQMQVTSDEVKVL